MALQIEGYTVFLVKCADGSYYSGMCKNLDKKVVEINNRLEGYFMSRPQLVPVTVVFQDDQVPFLEAYAKHRHLRSMTKRHRERLIKTSKWPKSKGIGKYLER